ncbi:hypothetical protein pb186bvf_004334 [Paramecium bursaria]
MITDNIGQYCNIRKFFSPEHGLRGDKQAGVAVDDYIDSYTGVKVVSLYGSKKAPTQEDLSDVDVLVYYIRDVGTRFYTYIWTMTYCMEAAQQKGIQFLIVDVPNLLGRKVEGCRNEMDAGLVGRKFGQFLGLPQRYGLTVGELALFINNEWMTNKVNIKVIPYSNSIYQWILPSPNMPSVDTATVYPGFGLFEGTDLSEGRGTTHPFEIIGGPKVQSELLAKDLNKQNLKGVIFRPIYFTPTFSKHVNLICGGVQIHVTNSTEFEPVKTAFITLEYFLQYSTITFNKMIDYESGLNNFSTLIQQKGALKILEDCQKDTNEFILKSQQYYIY